MRSYTFQRLARVSVLLALAAAALSPAGDVQAASFAVAADRPSPFAKGKRGFCFKNNCNQAVRVGQIGASSGIPCAEGCPGGTICNEAAEFCYFAVDLSKVGTLPAKSDRVCLEFTHPTVTTRVYTPQGMVNLKVDYSGAFYGSVGCDSEGRCETGICKDCKAYNGPIGPVTAAEMTLQPSLDFYDVTIIHGANLPIVMKPLAAPGRNFYFQEHAVPEYMCGEPGTVAPRRGEKKSSWSFLPRSEHGGSKYYSMVQDTGKPCSAGCAAGETCGVSMKIGGNGHPTADVGADTCGVPTGVWSDQELCAWTDAGDYSYCKKDLPNAERGGTHQQAFQCAGPYAESCFQRTAGQGCCGCSTWPHLDLPVEEQNPCFAESKGWMEFVEPRLRYLKEACPTCYTYPYDDATSTYTCKTGETYEEVNDASYEIEFCPDGVELTVATQGEQAIPIFSKPAESVAPPVTKDNGAATNAPDVTASPITKLPTPQTTWPSDNSSATSAATTIAVAALAAALMLVA